MGNDIPDILNVVHRDIRGALKSSWSRSLCTWGKIWRGCPLCSCKTFATWHNVIRCFGWEHEVYYGLLFPKAEVTSVNNIVYSRYCFTCDMDIWKHWSSVKMGFIRGYIVIHPLWVCALHFPRKLFNLFEQLYVGITTAVSIILSFWYDLRTSLYNNNFLYWRISCSTFIDHLAQCGQLVKSF